MPVYDWKNGSKDVLKGTQSWHFQISKCKGIILKKTNPKSVRVRGEVSYRNDLCQDKSLTKRGKKLNDTVLVSIPDEVPVKTSKLADVKNLLNKHYGNEWQKFEKLTYYKNVFTRGNNETADNDDESVVDTGDAENDEIIDFV